MTPIRLRLLAALALMCCITAARQEAAQDKAADEATAPSADALPEPRTVLPSLQAVLDPAGTLPGAMPVCPPQAWSILQGPILTEAAEAGRVPKLPDMPEYPQLPINLATALRLADARPLLIAAAQASLRTAVAQLDGAKAMWLPNVYMGGSYYYHGGGNQGNSGILLVNSRSQFTFGGGVAATLPVVEAIFAPLVMKQVVAARNFDVQTARNDALRDVAQYYFNVQEARGRLAGVEDAVTKSEDLARRIKGLAAELVAPVEVNRALTELADLEQELATARGQWRVSSAELTRMLRLNPGAVVVPLEPPYLQVTLIAPREPLEGLITIGLVNRPELASQQALVQAALARLKQEKLRPLVPNLLVVGDAVPAAPGNFLMGGIYGSSVNGHSNAWVGRIDPAVELLWELRNMGLGNVALTRERRAESDRAEVELFRTQDRVAAEVVQAQALLEAAAMRVARAETGIKEAQINFQGNVRGISETTRLGETLVLVNRPQEAVAALRQLIRAYDNYFTAVNEYNRSQFRLFHALGFPAHLLACDRPTGPLQPINTTRPPGMAPVP
jgi:outer membrane protein TolC